MTEPIFSSAAPATPGPHGSYAVLDQFGLIDAVGPEARTFLHNQLTNDVTHLEDNAARLGGFCSPKGRLIASFLYWDLPEMSGQENASMADNADGAHAGVPGGVRLMLAADIRDAIEKRLKMFVLRSKVKLTDGAASGPGAASGTSLIGLSARIDHAQTLKTLLEQQFGSIPEAVRELTHAKLGQANSRDSDGTLGTHPATLIRLPDAALCVRYLLVLSTAQWEARKAAFEAKLETVSPQFWDWLDVQSGEPRITAATQDKFVPQMINFEAIGGVNFRKGCYPGQEVVARSQYRGTVKRRAKVAHSAAAQAGDEIFDEADPLQPCGHVVNAAAAPGGGVDCLAELKLSLNADAKLHVGAIDGPLLMVLGLPYALPDLAA